MELLVLSWLVLQATNSPFQLGLVLVFNNLPRPFFSLFTGWIADRFSRHLMLIAAQVSNMLTAGSLLALIILDVIQPWHVFLVVFINKYFTFNFLTNFIYNALPIFNSVL